MIIERATEQTIETVLTSYIECALWSSTGQYCQTAGGWICQNEAHPKEDWPLDGHFGPDDIAPETVEQMRADVSAFLFTAWDDLQLDLSPIEPEQIGHDFWLTRNHHGAGFWDRGLGEIGDKLTELAHGYGEVDLYVGDDGQVHA